MRIRFLFQTALVLLLLFSGAVRASAPLATWYVVNVIGQVDEEEEEEPLLPKAGGKAAEEEEEEEPLLPKVDGAKGDLPEEEEEEPLLPKVGEPMDDNPFGVEGVAIDPEAPWVKEPVVDIVYIDVRGKKKPDPKHVEMLRTYWKTPLAFTKKYRVYVTNLKDGGFERTYTGQQIDSISYYEQRMLEHAAEQLDLTSNDLVRFRDKIDLSTPEAQASAIVAMTILQKGVNEHDSARQRGLRQGAYWDDEVRQPLIRAMYNIQYLTVQGSFSVENYEKAFEQCDKLRDDLRVENAALKSLYEEVFRMAFGEAFKREDFAAARGLLRQLENRVLPKPGDMASVYRKGLIDKASEEFAKVEGVTDKRRRLEILNRSHDIWPGIPAVERELRELIDNWVVMKCAYTHLPRNLTPLTAHAPVERHAVRLMYESLVHWVEDPKTGPHYVSQLAKGRPLPLPRGRLFHLPNCTWSDGHIGDVPKTLTSEDVRWTFKKLLANGNHAGHLYFRSWSDFIEVDARRPFEVAITTNTDYWQPLALMDFPVLPKHRFPEGGTKEELEAFERDPVGTGPYVLLPKDDVDEMRFVANPHYRRAGGPNIQEIAFNRMEFLEAEREFNVGNIHVIYGLNRDVAARLDRVGKRVDKLTTRSVNFLAPNHRRALKNKNLRLAIEHAIDREKILDTIFRPAKDSPDHAALTGPFPANSWVYKGRERELKPLFDRQSAITFLDRAKRSPDFTAGIPPLRLVYAARDADVQKACDEIKNQLNALGLDVKLDEVEPELFYDKVVNRHDFDLVYWRHDFEDETYWLLPLFDGFESEDGTTNFMGSVPDEVLRTKFQYLTLNKRFSDIQRLTFEIHEHVTKNALIVPLWQLDTYVAVHESLETTKLNPITLFDGVEDWKLQVEELPTR